MWKRGSEGSGFGSDTDDTLVDDDDGFGDLSYDQYCSYPIPDIGEDLEVKYVS